MSDEIIDTVSLKDHVIAPMKRSQVYAEGHVFRVINGFIINDAGNIWIPRRHGSKKLFPLHLDASVGGHVMSGETYDEAFHRETREELNIDPRLISHKRICKLSPSEHKTSAFMWVYLIYQNEVPHFNRDDFCEWYWMSIDDAFAALDAGDKAKSDLPKILTHIKHLL